MRVAGFIDVIDVVAIRNEIGQCDALCVVLDMRGAHHLGPRGLALLVEEKRLLARRGAELRVVDDQGSLELSPLFVVYRTVEEALAA